MVFTRLIVVSLAARLVLGYVVSPPGSAFPGADSNCSGWVEGGTQTCAEAEAAAGITDAEFEAWVRATPHSFENEGWRFEFNIISRIL
jgi:hypothetical protein